MGWASRVLGQSSSWGTSHPPNPGEPQVLHMEALPLASRGPYSCPQPASAPETLHTTPHTLLHPHTQPGCATPALNVISVVIWGGPFLLFSRNWGHQVGAHQSHALNLEPQLADPDRINGLCPGCLAKITVEVMRKVCRGWDLQTTFPRDLWGKGMRQTWDPTRTAPSRICQQLDLQPWAFHVTSNPHPYPWPPPCRTEVWVLTHSALPRPAGVTPHSNHPNPSPRSLQLISDKGLS